MEFTNELQTFSKALNCYVKIGTNDNKAIGFLHTMKLDYPLQFGTMLVKHKGEKFELNVKPD